MLPVPMPQRAYASPYTLALGPDKTAKYSRSTRALNPVCTTIYRTLPVPSVLGTHPLSLGRLFSYHIAGLCTTARTHHEQRAMMLASALVAAFTSTARFCSSCMSFFKTN